MKILIVEDITEKADTVTMFINKEYQNVEIVRTESYNSSLREICQNYNQYDLILLDMTMTTFDVSIEEDGGEPEPIAGYNILDSMFLRGIKTKVIVVSMYESFNGIKMAELDNELREQYPEIYLGNVHFAYSSTDWHQKLKNFLNQFI